jgi:hypothetical protein
MDLFVKVQLCQTYLTVCKHIIFFQGSCYFSLQSLVGYPRTLKIEFLRRHF